MSAPITQAATPVRGAGAAVGWLDAAAGGGLQLGLRAGWLLKHAISHLIVSGNTLVESRTFTPALSSPSVPIEGQAPLQALAASQAVRSAGPWESSKASARASSCSSGRVWIWAVGLLRGGRSGGLVGGPQPANPVPPWYGGFLRRGCRQSPC